ncbi:MAG: sugar phosphate isomerase/epimerase [Chloroflexi bacterium]|nr:sugar phosphate isomerase/epimerase [Chloroflexota bacterium]
MKLAFSRPTADEQEQRRLFDGFRPAGYSGLQLKPGQYGGFIHNPAAFLREWGADPGAPAALIAGGGLEDDGIAALRDLIAFAAAVRSERIVFCHAVSRKRVGDADIRRFAGILSTLGREASSAGVRLSLHHHFDQPVMHRADFDNFFGAVSDAAVGLTLDTAHLAKSGISDIAGLVRDMSPVIDNLHLKDFAGGEFQVLGEGTIDFRPVFAAIKEIGYDGWLCADEESGGDLDAGMHACAAFLRRRLIWQR